MHRPRYELGTQSLYVPVDMPAPLHSAVFTNPEPLPSLVSVSVEVPLCRHN